MNSFRPISFPCSFGTEVILPGDLGLHVLDGRVIAQLEFDLLSCLHGARLLSVTSLLDLLHDFKFKLQRKVKTL